MQAFIAFAARKFGSFKDIDYLCTQKRAKLGGTSAIGASSIAFGLHELWQKIKLQKYE